MTNVFSKISSIVLAAIIISSCSKSNDNPANASLEGSFRYQKAIARINNVDVDLNNQQPPCALDDVFEFGAQGSFRALDGNNVCVPSGNLTGTYTRNGNNIQIVNSNGSLTLTIITLTTTQLVFESYSDRFQQNIQIYMTRL
jgi:hypothetical protein